MSNKKPPMLPTGIQSPLTGLIEQAWRQVGHNFSALERAVARSNGDREGLYVDRRKLTDLKNGKLNVTLSLSEIVALNRYFVDCGLGGFLRRLRLWETLADASDVLILVGSYIREEERRNDVSIWDLQAAMAASNAMQETRSGFSIAVRDVPMREHAASMGLDGLIRDYGGSSRSSVFIVGSPRACVASEIALAEMFGVEPFSRSSSESIPFRFIWPTESGADPARQSSFQVFPSQPRKRMHSVSSGHPWDYKLGVQIGDDTRWEFPTKPRHTYGVVAVKRRPSGILCVVAAGLTGPASLGCVQALRDIPALSGYTFGQCPSEGFWAFVQAPVEETGHPGEDRVLGKVDLLSQPRAIK